jgi:hypothetical protein
MRTPVPFHESNSLKYFIENLVGLSRWSWLYIKSNETNITLSTVCHPTAVDSREMSDDEVDEFEAYAEQSGLRCFFSRDQLEEIIANLNQQCSNFTEHQLVAAISFYWRHDAFIDITASST